MPTQSLVVTERAWTQFVENDQLDAQFLRTEVANSWRRCRTLKVDPFESIEGSVNKLELRERLQRRQLLMKIARPFLDNLYNFVKGSGFQVVLSDESGFLLEVLGDNEIVSRTRHVHLCPGGDWSEASKGTNAIGTAIIERKPVQIYATEHYCQAHHFLTCSAAPIFDPEGVLLGTLDISGDYHVANAHTLGMVVAAANAIENQLRLLSATDKLYMAYRYSNILLENMSDGLISINNNGIITEINAKAGEMFAVNPALVKGRHVSHINRDTTVLSVLSEGAENPTKETILEKMGKRIHSSASPLRDEGGQIIGAVAVFRELSRQLTKRPAALHPHRYTFDDIVGVSPGTTAAKEWAQVAAASPSTVLIKGESGTGKELFAQAIHNASPRKDCPFIAINSAALPENLIESELFGYQDGSFTGAKKGGQAGKFELADGGTIFLDEIGDMPLSVQAKLLRVIQEKKVARIGSSNERPVEFRIIAATHKDLYAEMQNGNFRQDLYYRLNVVEIKIPPLRERKEEIPALTLHLVQKIASKFNWKVPEIQNEFIHDLQQYDWPGNIRELENAIERAIIRAGENGAVTAEFLELPNREPAREQIASPELPAPTENRPTVRSLKEVEKEMISESFSHFQGNIQRAAAKLGIGRNTFYRKMKEYGIS